MPKQLTISGSDDKKPIEVQVEQLGGDMATTAKFINSTQSSEIFAFPVNVTADLTVTSTNLIQIAPFVINFDSTADYVDFDIDMCVSATADLFIDLQVDGTSVLNKPFCISGTNKQQLGIDRKITLAAGNHTMKVLWKVSSGTGTLHSVGNNYIQGFNYF